MFSISNITGMLPAPVELILLGIGAITLARKLLGGLNLFSTFVLSGTNVRQPLAIADTSQLAMSCSVTNLNFVC